jgi:hypothetical protein
LSHDAAQSHSVQESSALQDMALELHHEFECSFGAHKLSHDAAQSHSVQESSALQDMALELHHAWH